MEARAGVVRGSGMAGRRLRADSAGGSASVLALVGWLAATLSPAAARASCNAVPGAEVTFRSARGSVDRPHASPGDFVALSLDGGGCDVGGPSLVDLGGAPGAADDYAVTL